MSRRRSSKSTGAGQRATIGGVTALVILVIVAIAQYVLGINVLNTGENTPAPITSAPVTTPQPTAGPSTPGAVVAINGGIDGGWFQLYFTTPINTEDPSRFNGSPLENALVQAIDGAKTSIDLAVYQFNSQPVTDALLRAKTQRSVAIRVVTDGEFGLESPDGTLDQIEAAGIPVVSDGSRGGYMHNKFFVIDSLYVWTGSTNITNNDIYNNNNSSMLIRSTQLAQNYTNEFNKMFVSKQFGASKSKTVPNPNIIVNGTEIENLFEAEGDVPSRLVELIDDAQSIRFMAFSFSRDDMMQAVLNRVESGQADALGIIEASQRRFAKPLFCAQVQGLQIRQDGNPDVLHSKVFIFDSSIVVIGSFNFSNNAANDNDENTLIIHNPDIAQAYLDEFNRRWQEARAVSASTLGC
jgi:phosphatidylserine/phosphatidylglycerophosphate/cardiolipin synthase-like enzyme